MRSAVVRPADTRSRVEQVIGMPVGIALRGRHAATSAGRTAQRAVVKELRRLDRIFNIDRRDSVISRLGRGELTVDRCPAEVTEVLALSGDAEQQSDGAFSIVLPDRNGRLRLDPSGVVRGWAVERASRFLAALDDTDFCLSAAGDTVCRAGADRPEWQIGIEHPHDPTSLIAVGSIRIGALATRSGPRRRGQHVLDARTGRPVQGVTSVTVIDDSPTWAAIDAAAAYAHGPEAANWLRARARAALVVWPDGTNTVVEGPGTTQTPRHAIHLNHQPHTPKGSMS